MAKPRGEDKVYSDFLTNIAVAWFSAGIIAPLVTPLSGTPKFSGSFIGIIGCIISLRLAVMFRRSL